MVIFDDPIQLKGTDLGCLETRVSALGRPTFELAATEITTHKYVAGNTIGLRPHDSLKVLQRRKVLSKSEGYRVVLNHLIIDGPNSNVLVSKNLQKRLRIGTAAGDYYPAAAD